ncbi:tRNA 2-selenouridine(34) synthase MnmH, partial [Klebsiella pneumoniae]
WQQFGSFPHPGMLPTRRRGGLPLFVHHNKRLNEAQCTQQCTASTEAHFAWLVPLLEEYYDPMYRYQLGKKAGKILFRGSWQEVAAWLAK